MPIIQAVIVGGGKGCRDLLLLFEDYQPRHVKLEILGVADINPEAPGFKFARQKGFFTTTNFLELFEKFPELDLIIELTGRDDVLAKLWELRPKRANILDHTTALIFWEIITLLRERNLCELRLQEAEKTELYMELISHFAHELRNPLMVIGGLARRLSKDNEIEPEKLREYTHIIAQEVEKLEGLMRYLSKVVEPLKPFFEPVSLNELVTQTVKEFKEIHPDLELKVLLEPEMPEIYADKGLLKKALWELLKNAAEAVEKETSKRSILIETKLCYDTLAIIVKDTGPGVDEEILHLATLPFFTKKPGHLGLGLYFVSKVASAHGGQFYLFSKEGEGTVAVIELPPRMVERPPLI